MGYVASAPVLCVLLPAHTCTLRTIAHYGKGSEHFGQLSTVTRGLRRSEYDGESRMGQEKSKPSQQFAIV